MGERTLKAHCDALGEALKPSPYVTELEQALKEIRALAANEQAQPSGLHMTCLSLIEKRAAQALLA